MTPRIEDKNNEYDKLRINKEQAEPVEEGDLAPGPGRASARAKR
jgi:hypothetical protein